MVVPTKHRFGVKEYYRMAETGVLPLNARVELLNGEIIDISPIGPFHGSVTKLLNRRAGPVDHINSRSSPPG